MDIPAAKMARALGTNGFGSVTLFILYGVRHLGRNNLD